jgi:hypothetical protein
MEILAQCLGTSIYGFGVLLAKDRLGKFRLVLASHALLGMLWRGLFWHLV